MQLRRHPLARALHVQHQFAEETLGIGIRHERKRFAVDGAGSTGAPDSMHVRLDIPRDVQRDDRAHRRDVQPARRDVRGDQHVRLAFPKRPERGGPIRLVHVPVQSLDPDSNIPQRRLARLHVRPAADEDEHLALVHELSRALNEPRQPSIVGSVGENFGELRHVRVGPTRPPHRDRQRVASHDVIAQRSHARRHRRREQRSLSVRPAPVAYRPDLRLEPHVQHPVRLVQYQIRDPP